MLLLTGALTSKPYAFTARPWELRSVESIDVLDGLGSNIRIDFKESEIVRILPRRNPDINEGWISDKIRFFYDSLKRQRLTSPYIKEKGELKKVKWSSLVSTLSSVFKVYSYEYGNSKIGVVAGSNLDTESLYALKDFSQNLGFSLLGLDNSLKINSDNPQSYSFLPEIKSLEDADFCLLIGTNPRFEASMVNLRLRKIFRRGGLQIASLGTNFSTTYPYTSGGLTTKALVALVEGKHSFCKNLAKAKKPVIIFGSKLLERSDAPAISSLLKVLSEKVSFVAETSIFSNPLALDANSVGGFELGFLPFHEKDLKNKKLLYFAGVENTSLYSKLSRNGKSPLLVLQSSHGNNLTKIGDFVLPSLTFTEKSGVYYNLEGRPQKTQRALVGPALAREDWKIVRAFYHSLDKASFYSTKFQLGTEITKSLPSYSFANSWFSTKSKNFHLSFSFAPLERVSKTPLKLGVEDFYMTNFLCHSSRIMAKASEFLRSWSNNYKFLTYLSLK